LKVVESHALNLEAEEVVQRSSGVRRSMKQLHKSDVEWEERARELYRRLRPQIETPESIGKMIVMEVESGDYEIDDLGIESSRRLHARHPGASLYALRIGYETVESFGGLRERAMP
jgi:hypothetical protein